MKIAGMQKMTLLDYPGKVACTVFLQGCNFRCPFCHNSDLLGPQGQDLLEEGALLTFLEKRRGLLDGVCITGGEPTLQQDLPELLRRIKALGYPVKLDTNGSRPEVLKQLVSGGLVDYVAMDIKNSPERYRQTAGCPGLKLEAVEESMRYLLSGPVDYEFRTTVVAEFHEEEAMAEMCRWVQELARGGKAKRFFLQGYVDRDSVLSEGLHAAEDGKMHRFLELLAPCAELAQIRGLDT